MKYNLLLSEKPTSSSTHIKYTDYMIEILSDLYGMYWIIIIPFGSLTWLLRLYELKRLKSKHPEEFI